jgi:hypothetical protein
MKRRAWGFLGHDAYRATWRVRFFARLAQRTTAGAALFALLSLVASTAAAEPVQGTGQDAAIAKSSALAIGDFPTGWRARKDAGARERAEARAQIRKCKSFNALAKKLKRVPRVSDKQFAEGDQTYASNSVFVLRDDESASRAFETLSAGDFGTCQSKQAEKVAESQLKKSDAKFDEVKSDVGELSVEQAGDATAAFEAVITVTRGSSSEKIYGDIASVRVGRAIAFFSFVSTFTQFPDLKTALIDAVVSRLRNSLGSPTAQPASSANASRPLSTEATVPGGKVTVYGYEQPASGLNRYQTPQQPNSEFSAVDAQVCATGASGLDANSFDFRLQFSDNSQREPSYGKEPALNSTKVATGDCLRGWITFEVPAGQRPGFVLYRVQTSTGGTPPPIKWSV